MVAVSDETHALITPHPRRRPGLKPSSLQSRILLEDAAVCPGAQWRRYSPKRTGHLFGESGACTGGEGLYPNEGHSRLPTTRQMTSTCSTNSTLTLYNRWRNGICVNMRISIHWSPRLRGLSVQTVSSLHLTHHDSCKLLQYDTHHTKSEVNVNSS